jgi:hypothetical protein
MCVPSTCSSLAALPRTHSEEETGMRIGSGIGLAVIALVALAALPSEAVAERSERITVQDSTAGAPTAFRAAPLDSGYAIAVANAEHVPAMALATSRSATVSILRADSNATGLALASPVESGITAKSGMRTLTNLTNLTNIVDSLSDRSRRALHRQPRGIGSDTRGSQALSG